MSRLLALRLALLALVPSLSAATASPPPNVRANARDGDPPGRVQSEVALGVHAGTVVAIWNDAVGYYHDASMCGVGVSLDGGRTFRDAGGLPETGGMRVSGDPWMTVTPAGDFLVASVDTGNDDGIAIHRGRREGDALVWSEISSYVRAGGEALDKPALDHDPESGALYLTYVNWSQNRGELARSDDLGLTWSEPLVVFESSRATGYVPAADGRGGVAVAWVDRIGQPGSVLYVRYSAPGGLAWETEPTPVVTLGPHAHEPPAGYDREVNATFPSLAFAHGLAVPRMLLAWTDGSPGAFEVFVGSSDDHGRTWRAPARLRDARAPGEAFWPALATHPDGRVVAGWYDRRCGASAPGGDTSATGFHVAASPDHGRSFGPDHPMSDRCVRWEDVPADFTPNFGDYVDVALDAHTITAAWADARDGDPDVFVARRADILPLRVAVTDGDHTRVRDGRVETLAAAARIGGATGSVSVEDALVLAPLAALAPGREIPPLLPASGGRMIGTLTLSSASRSPLRMELSLEADDQLSPTDSSCARLEATLVRTGAPIGRSARRWLTTLRLTPGPLDTLAVAGHVETSGRAYGISGRVVVTPGPALAAPRDVRQEAWLVAGNLHVRTRVMDTDPPATAPGAASAGTAGAGTAIDGATRVAPGARALRLLVLPNPVTPAGRVRVELPRGTASALRVYDVHGRLVRTVAGRDARREPTGGASGGAGVREVRVMDAVDDRGRALGPGVYFVRLETRLRGVLAAAKLIVSR